MVVHLRISFLDFLNRAMTTLYRERFLAGCENPLMGLTQKIAQNQNVKSSGWNFVMVANRRRQTTARTQSETEAYLNDLGFEANCTSAPYPWLFMQNAARLCTTLPVRLYIIEHLNSWFREFSTRLHDSELPWFQSSCCKLINRSSLPKDFSHFPSINRDLHKLSMPPARSKSHADLHTIVNLIRALDGQ